MAAKQRSPLAQGVHIVVDPDSIKVGINTIGRFVGDFGKKFSAQFPEVLLAWSKHFNKVLPQTTRAVTHLRTGTLSTKMELIMARRGTSNTPTVFEMNYHDDQLANYAPTLETGRIQGQGPGHIVPLASWLKYKGRRYVTSAQITADMKKKGAFMPKKEIETVSGPARIFLFRRKSATTGRTDTMQRTNRGAKRIKRYLLKDNVVGMYLLYDSQRGIYGKSKDFRKQAPALRMPVGLKIMKQLQPKTTAPHWFSRTLARSLPKLIDAISSLYVKTKPGATADSASKHLVTVLKEKVSR